MRIPNHNYLWRNLRRRPIQNASAGFTFLEVIAALSILGILTAIFGMGLVAAVQSHEFSRTNVHIVQKAQLAMTRMNRELLELTDVIAISGQGDDPYIIYERLVEGGTPSLVRMGLHHHPTDGVVRLYTNLGSGVAELNSSTIDQGDALVNEVQTLSLGYFQGSSDWDTGADIQLLSTIDLTLSLNRSDKPGQTQDFTTRIHMRNTNNFGGAAPTINPVSRSDYSCYIDHLTGTFAP